MRSGKEIQSQGVRDKKIVQLRGAKGREGVRLYPLGWRLLLGSGTSERGQKGLCTAAGVQEPLAQANSNRSDAKERIIRSRVLHLPSSMGFLLSRSMEDWPNLVFSFQGEATSHKC